MRSFVIQEISYSNNADTMIKRLNNSETEIINSHSFINESTIDLSDKVSYNKKLPLILYQTEIQRDRNTAFL
jgi:hypothetical protein